MNNNSTNPFLYLQRISHDDINVVYHDLFKQLVLSEELHKDVYVKLKKRSGTENPEIGSKELDRIRKQIFTLKDHSFRFKPTRRLKDITKFSKSLKAIRRLETKKRFTRSLKPTKKWNKKKKQVCVPSFYDKIVLEIFSLILNAVYKNSFSQFVHGFRKNQNEHTALKEVCKKWRNIDWFLEGDISSCLQKIDYKLLAKLLNVRLKDQQLLDLFWKAVNVGYVGFKKDISIEYGKYPHVSSIAPVLANLYFSSFDRFCEQQIEEADRSGEPKARNPEYYRIAARIGKYYKKIKENNISKVQKEDLLKLRVLRSQTRCTKRGPGYRLFYVRFTDTFLIGIHGTRNQMQLVKKSLGLFLNKEYSVISDNALKEVNALKSKARFLNFDLFRRVSRTNQQKKVIRYLLNKNGTKQRSAARIPTSIVTINMPTRYLVFKLASYGICRVKDYNSGEIFAKTKRNWSCFRHQDIIIKYQGLLNSLSNYYISASNFSRFCFIQHIIKNSACLTIAHKFKIGSRRKTYKKFGSNLAPFSQIDSSKKKERPGGLTLMESFKRLPYKSAFSNKYNAKHEISSPFIVFYYATRSNIIKWGTPCSLCGATKSVEMHHLRHLKGRPKGFIKQAGALKRKQVPLCKACHRKVHAGKYDSKALRSLVP